MFCSYRHPGWTDERYGQECMLYEAKRRCMLTNGVRVVRMAEYSEYMKYVEETYGADFFDKYMKLAPARQRQAPASSPLASSYTRCPQSYIAVIPALCR